MILECSLRETPSSLKSGANGSSQLRNPAFELNQKRFLPCKVDFTSESFPSCCVARLVSKKVVALRRWIGNIKRKLTIYCLN